MYSLLLSYLQVPAADVEMLTSAYCSIGRLSRTKSARIAPFATNASELIAAAWLRAKFTSDWEGKHAGGGADGGGANGGGTRGGGPVGGDEAAWHVQ